MQLDLSKLPDPPPRAAAPRSGGLDLSKLPDPPRPAAAAPEGGVWDWVVDTAVPTALRVGGGVGGAILGGVLGAPTGPGALASAAAGGALGSAAGTTAAQAYEIWRGRREEFNPTAIAVDTALGAVPVIGKAGAPLRTVLSRAGQGAVLGAGGDAAMRWAEGEDQSLTGSLTAGAIGGAVGGALGGLEARNLARRAARLDVSALPDPPRVPTLDAPTVPPVVAQADVPAAPVDPSRLEQRTRPAETTVQVNELPSESSYRLYRRGTGQPTDIDSTAKPQGVYYSIVDSPRFRSPHVDAGDVETHAIGRPKNPLVLEAGPKMRHERGGGYSVAPSAGVEALRRLDPDAFERLRNASKSEVLAELQARFPGADYDKFSFDAYELMESYGAQLARQSGFDALVLRDRTAAGWRRNFPDDTPGDFSEYVELAPTSTPAAAPGTPAFQQTTRLTDGPALDPSNLAPRASNTMPIDAPASNNPSLGSEPMDLEPVRTPREPVSPEAARVARDVPAAPVDPSRFEQRVRQTAAVPTTPLVQPKSPSQMTAREALDAFTEEGYTVEIFDDEVGKWIPERTGSFTRDTGTRSSRAKLKKGSRAADAYARLNELGQAEVEAAWSQPSNAFRPTRPSAVDPSRFQQATRLTDGPSLTPIDAPAAKNPSLGSASDILESGTVDDQLVRTPRETTSPEAARVARVVNQDGLPPTAPIPESRRITESMAARFPEEQRDDLLGIIEKNNAFEYQRRGVQTDARRAALAQHLQMDLSTRLRPGTILNAEETDHLAGALVGVQDRIKDLAAKVAAGQADTFDTFNLAAARQEQATLVASYLGTRAEQGRALRAHRFMAQVIRSGDLGAIRKILAEHPDLKNIEGFADEFLKRGTDAEKMQYALDELRKNRSWGDTALAVYYANILSGVKTHLRNLMGSGANLTFREVSNAVGVGYDAARSKLTGAPRTMFADEIPARAVGAFQGVRKGLADAAFVLKHGYGREALEAFDTPRVELAGGAKNPFNLPGRALEAEDALMYRMVYEANVAGRLQSRARQAAVKAGAFGPDADRMVGDLVAEGMLNVPKEVAEASQQAAQQALFREEPGAFVKWILEKKNAGPMGKALSFVVPFVRVPGNIFRQALENNLVGGFATQQGRAALRAGGREQAEMVGRMVTGTAALGVLATWVAQGRVSGGGPSNPNERAALMETGWKPYSVNIPGVGWVDYNLMFQSVALPLSALANAWEMYTASGDEKALDDLAVSSVMSMGGTLLDQSFLSGASDFNAAMTSPEQYAKNWAARTAQGFVPLSGLQRNVAQTIDPMVRDTSDPSLVTQVGKGVQSIVPGMSAQLPPRLDRFGQPVERTGGRAAGMSPITASTPNMDPVVQGLERLGIRSIGLPAKEIGKEGSRSNPRQVLTPEERAEMGQAVHVALEQLFRTSLPALEQMDPAAAEARVQRVVDDARARVRAEIQRERRTR